MRCWNDEPAGPRVLSSLSVDFTRNRRGIPAAVEVAMDEETGIRPLNRTRRMRRLNFRLRTLDDDRGFRGVTALGRHAGHPVDHLCILGERGGEEAGRLSSRYPGPGASAAKGLTAKEAELLAFGHRMMEYLARQQARYERAARYPWFPREPDPPPPR